MLAYMMADPKARGTAKASVRRQEVALTAQLGAPLNQGPWPRARPATARTVGTT